MAFKSVPIFFEEAQRAQVEAQQFLEAIRPLLPEGIVEADFSNEATSETEEPE